MSNKLYKKESGYIEISLIFIVLLVSLVSISYLKLTQTSLNYSDTFASNTANENKSISEGRLNSYIFNQNIANMFSINIDNITNYDEYTYKLSLNTTPLSQKILPIESMVEKPNFFNTYYDFSEFEYYSEIKNGDFKTYTFIKESLCTEINVGERCRSIETVTISIYKDKIYFADFIKSKHLFNLEVSYILDSENNPVTIYTTNYTGLYKENIITGENSVLKKLP